MADLVDVSSSDDKDRAPTKAEDRAPDTKKSSGRGAKIRSAISSAGADLNRSSVENLQRMANMPSFKRGGTMRKKGVARLHKGELIKKPRKSKRGFGRM